MKIAVLSDIHGNDLALKAVLNEAKANQVEQLFILGDIVGYYFRSDLVILLLEEWPLELIQGNHEEMLKKALLDPNYLLKYTREYGFGLKLALEKLSPLWLNRLTHLPIQKIIEIDHLTFSLVHGSPWDPNEYIYPDSSEVIFNKLFAQKADFILLGHTHHSFIRQKEGKTIINPGSVGQNRKQGGIAEWCLIDTKLKIAEIKQTEYDPSEIALEVKEKNPECPYLFNILYRNNLPLISSSFTFNQFPSELFSTILVTGAGGDIAQSIGKLLKKENATHKIIGTDLHHEHAGIFIFDKVEIISPVSSKEYISDLSQLVKKHKVDLIIPMSEPELKFFYRQKITKVDRASLLMANEKSLKIGFDKLKTVQFLQEIGLNYPWTKLVGVEQPLELPCILKSRDGSGSKSVALVNETNFDFFVKNKFGFIFQEYLKPDEEEYTCGLYRFKNGSIRTIIFRRKLHGDCTGYGEVIQNKEIEADLIKLAQKIDLKGSINVQLRLTERGPVIFEINPRFSSTVFFRHLLGFKDLIWSLQEVKGETIENYLPPSPGTKIYRGYQEFVLKNKLNYNYAEIGFVELEEKFKLRPVNNTDLDCLFAWRNDPQTVASSFSGRTISFEEHQQWFTKMQSDPKITFFIAINSNNDKIGQVRFEQNQNYAELDLTVNPLFRRRQFGSLILQQAVDLYLQNNAVDFLVAKIKKENHPSFRTFLKADFKIYREFSCYFELRRLRHVN